MLKSTNIEIICQRSEYLQASPTLDHRLKWDLFRLPELECFDAMLNKLFKKELAELVMRFYSDIAYCEFHGDCLQVRGGEVQDVSGAG